MLQLGKSFPAGLLILSTLMWSAIASPAQTSIETNGQPAGSHATQPSDSGAAAKPGANSPSAISTPVESMTSTQFPGELQPGTDPENKLFSPFVRHMARDQAQFWSSPREWKKPDTLKTFLSFVGFTGALIAGDSWISKQVPDAPGQLRRSKQISDYGTVSLIGAAAGSYAFGAFTHREHLRETGFLSAEAAIDSLMVTYALREITQRQRPYEGNGNASFFHGGSSFPSEHAAVAWSVASVFAHEYPGPLSKIAAYGLASAVTLTRVTGRQHFASDVVVGSALGWYFARQVYRAHHDPELGGAPWGDLVQTDFVQAKQRSSGNPKRMGSPYVPVESWIYPAFDRLIALGYVRTAITGMRPWTRLECARLLNESDDLLQGAGAGAIAGNENNGNESEALSLYHSLTEEFSPDLRLLDGESNHNLQAESIYSRATGIAGTPLTDGFHFGQTLSNDDGRPFAEGFNAVNGISLSAAAGPLTAYVRGEYDSAPAIPALPLTARTFIAGADGPLPVAPDVPTAATSRFDLLDAYVAVNFENWQLSFGRQSLKWGPSESGNLMFSANAAPVTMLRVDRVSPFKLPGILGLMGPTRYEFFLGRLTGHDFVFGTSTGLIGQWGVPLSDQPFIVGQKLNFRPTPNFEFGVDYTRIAGGTGQPFTFHQLLESTLSLSNGKPGTSSDPGDIRSGVDFSYKIPGLRNWLTFYGDAFSEDELSPLAYPRKSVFEGGLYLARLPRLRKLDLRAEGGSTSPVDFSTCNGCFYQNTRFINAYTNGGNLLGSWLGRASQGEQLWSTYWLSARNTVQFNFRHRKIDRQFLPQGGTVNDEGVKADFWLGTSVRLTGSAQYEQWNIPLLTSRARSNLATSLELSIWPRHWGVR
jgi:membrane-associated phospholipid phosphatase